jgi:hypothetical protein
MERLQERMYRTTWFLDVALSAWVSFYTAENTFISLMSWAKKHLTETLVIVYAIDR